MASFASRSVTSFLDIQLFLIVLAIGVLISGFSTDLAMGIAIGVLFPPHMAIMMGFGGIVRILLDRKFGKKESKEKSSIMGPGLAVGASFVIPIMIVMALIM